MGARGFGRYRDLRVLGGCYIHWVCVVTKPIEACHRQFGARLESMRDVLGITQQELADRVGMSRGSIANIETGRQRILLHDVETFARALGSTPKALMRGIWL